MQTKIIDLKQAPVVLVELGVDDVSYYNIDPFVRKGLETEGYMFEGFFSDLTEEQFAECVNKPHYAQIFSKRIGPFYSDYTNQGRNMMSAKYSWDTLLESEGVYTENPFGGEPFYTDGTFRKDIEKWQEAQSRTIDPERTVVLLRKEVKDINKATGG